MIDRLMLTSVNLERSKRFYEAALAPLDYELVVEDPEGHELGFGLVSKVDLWIQSGPPSSIQVRVALRAENRRQVDEFYQAALAAGGYDNGPPLQRSDYLREHLDRELWAWYENFPPNYREAYGPNCYAAAVRDPDGHSIEVVYRGT